MRFIQSGETKFLGGTFDLFFPLTNRQLQQYMIILPAVGIACDWLQVSTRTEAALCSVIVPPRESIQPLSAACLRHTAVARDEG